MNCKRIISLCLTFGMLLAFVSCSSVSGVLDKILISVSNESETEECNETADILISGNDEIICTIEKILETDLFYVRVIDNNPDINDSKALLKILSDPYNRKITEGDKLKVNVFTVTGGDLIYIEADNFEYISEESTDNDSTSRLRNIIKEYYTSGLAFNYPVENVSISSVFRILGTVYSQDKTKKMLILSDSPHNSGIVFTLSIDADIVLSEDEYIYIDAEQVYNCSYLTETCVEPIYIFLENENIRYRDATEDEVFIFIQEHEIVEPKKPVIYLYPEHDTECSVKLHLDGKLTCSFPDYGDNGWNYFLAKPDGTLLFPDGKEYYCLYWEGISDMEFDYSKGFCVKGCDTAEFLEMILPKIGLNYAEANEFIIYWLPRLQNNKYNVISFQTDAYTDKAILEVTPSPDSILRVFMAAYATDEYVVLEPQEFSVFERKGFCVVEWGGAINNR